MADILVHPTELRKIASQMRGSAKKIGQALQVVDADILSLKGDKFMGRRADAMQVHYAPKREALLRAKDLVAHFAEDLQAAATNFEQADRNGDSSSTPFVESPRIKPTTPPTPIAKPKLPKVSDIALNQWDKRWANIKMNNHTGETLRNYGCLETVTAMIARAYGKDVTPVDVDNWIEAHGGYPSSGSYMPAGSQAGFLNEVLGRKGSVVNIKESEINTYLDAGTPVVLHINSSSNPTDGHYVLAVGIDAKGNYICADPNGGKQVTVSASNIRDARVYC